MAEQSGVILGGVILAAGASSRMGRDKALLPWPAASSHSTLLAAHIAALKPFAPAIVVVAGANADRLAPFIAQCGATLAVNPDPERGQFSSLQIGLSEVLVRGYGAAMITPVDCPPLSATTLASLRRGFEDALKRGLWAIAPENSGKHGHPLLVNCEFIRAFLDAPVTTNAREVLHAHARRIEYLAVPDSLAKTGMNTSEEYAATIARSQSRPA